MSWYPALPLENEREEQRPRGKPAEWTADGRRWWQAVPWGVEDGAHFGSVSGEVQGSQESTYGGRSGSKCPPMAMRVKAVSHKETSLPLLTLSSLSSLCPILWGTSYYLLGVWEGRGEVSSLKVTYSVRIERCYLRMTKEAIRPDHIGEIYSYILKEKWKVK